MRRLRLLVFCSFGALLAVTTAITLVAVRYSIRKQTSALASTHIAYLRAAFLTLPHDHRGLPATPSLLLLRQGLQALRPELGFEVIVDGVTLSGGAATPLQRRAAATIRSQPGKPYFEITGPIGEQVFTHVEALKGNPSFLLEVHSPLAPVRHKSNQVTLLAAVRRPASPSSRSRARPTARRSPTSSRWTGIPPPCWRCTGRRPPWAS